ncbi:MAG TPA: hypothetical protein VJB67_01035 [Patescibacteria group bacterium]|nr:hypothetical protein [Patescibacteria group bacterium]
MSKERFYYWYIEPLDAKTNEIIGKNLSESDFSENLRCADEVLRSMWACSHLLIERFTDSQRQLGIRFNVYCQEGNGPIRRWKFIVKPKAKVKPRL